MRGYSNENILWRQIIAKSKLEKEGIFYPIKLEYYKSIETKENRPSDNYARFGYKCSKNGSIYQTT